MTEHRGGQRNRRGPAKGPFAPSSHERSNGGGSSHGAASEGPARPGAAGLHAAGPVPRGQPKLAADRVGERMSALKLSDSETIVCITETKGKLRQINELAKRHNARAIIHTGDFGFHDGESHKHLCCTELRHAVQFSSLHPGERGRLLERSDQDLRKACEGVHLSDLPLYLSGKERFDVPVYVIWGNQEDVEVLKKFADGSYHVPNLCILNEKSSYTISLGQHTLRLFGVGGSFHSYRCLDNGLGHELVSGAEGAMWVTLLHLGHLIELAERFDDPAEVRVFLTHDAPGKQSIMNQVAAALKADFTLSGSLHARFCQAYTDSSVRTMENYLEHVGAIQKELSLIWEEVQRITGKDSITPEDRRCIERVLAAVQHAPGSDMELKDTWHLNLADVKHGHMLMRMSPKKGVMIETVADYGWHVGHARSNSKVHQEEKQPRKTPLQHVTKSAAADRELCRAAEAPAKAPGNHSERKAAPPKQAEGPSRRPGTPPPTGAKPASRKSQAVPAQQEEALDWVLESPPKVAPSKPGAQAVEVASEKALRVKSPVFGNAVKSAFTGSPAELNGTDGLPPASAASASEAPAAAVAAAASTKAELDWDRASACRKDPLVLKVYGVAPDMSEEEIAKAYGFRHLPITKLTRTATVLLLEFEDEGALRRVRNLIPSLKFGGTYLTLSNVGPLPTATSVAAPVSRSAGTGTVPAKTTNPKPTGASVARPSAAASSAAAPVGRQAAPASAEAPFKSSMVIGGIPEGTTIADLEAKFCMKSWKVSEARLLNGKLHVTVERQDDFERLIRLIPSLRHGDQALQIIQANLVTASSKGSAPAEAEPPAAKPEAPAVKPEAPAAKPETPAAKPETPAVKPKAPAKPPAPQSWAISGLTWDDQ